MGFKKVLSVENKERKKLNKNPKQESLQEMIQMLKGDYNFPVKLWVWGKVVKEWAGIIIVFTIFFLIVLFVVLAINGRGSKVETQSIKPMEGIEEMEKAKAEQDLTPHLKEVAEFMKTSAESVNERQEIVERLAQMVALYAGTTLNQTQLENKLESFSSLLSTCNKSRGRYMDRFANNINPFNDPNISRAFDKLVVGHFFISPHALDPQEENKRWEALCAFCRQEANKTKDELVQTLKSGEGTQTIEKTEGLKVKNSFFK